MEYVIFRYKIEEHLTSCSPKKVFPTKFQLARKGETGQLAWRKGTPFCKILMFKNIILLFFVLVMVFKGDLTTV